MDSYRPVAIVRCAVSGDGTACDGWTTADDCPQGDRERDGDRVALEAALGKQGVGAAIAMEYRLEAGNPRWWQLTLR